MIRIGTAGWSVPTPLRDRFPAEGPILQRYAAVFDGVEINSSFYRPHKPETYARWAASTPEGFRFAVKAPKTVTHERRLVDVAEPLGRFLDESAALGARRGPVLIQLPPSLGFDPAVAESFLAALRARYDGEAVLEPRHASWFTPEADTLLVRRRIARVAADPALSDAARTPGGWSGVPYWRLHGSPRIYATAYGRERLEALSAHLVSPAWVIFDNTTFGAATADALILQAILRSQAQDAKLEP